LKSFFEDCVGCDDVFGFRGSAAVVGVMDLDEFVVAEVEFFFGGGKLGETKNREGIFVLDDVTGLVAGHVVPGGSPFVNIAASLRVIISFVPVEEATFGFAGFWHHISPTDKDMIEKLNPPEEVFGGEGTEMVWVGNEVDSGEV